MDNKRDMQFFINRRTPRSHSEREFCPCCGDLVYRLQGMVYLCDLDIKQSTDYRVSRVFIIHFCDRRKIEAFEAPFKEKERKLLAESFAAAVNQGKNC